jgi:hypothetical protein
LQTVPRWELAEVAAEAKAQVLVSGTSLKAALDRNWDDSQERQEALSVVLAALTAVEDWLETQPESKADPVVQAHMQTAQQIKAQDVELTQSGAATLRKGVAKDRRISIEDAQMRAFPQKSQRARRWIQTARLARFRQRFGASRGHHSS